MLACDCSCVCRLIDVLFREMQLYLVFEYLECDLKRYMEAGLEQPELRLSPDLIQVSVYISYAARLPSDRVHPRSPTRTNC